MYSSSHNSRSKASKKKRKPKGSVPLGVYNEGSTTGANGAGEPGILSPAKEVCHCGASGDACLPGGDVNRCPFGRPWNCLRQLRLFS